MVNKPRSEENSISSCNYARSSKGRGTSQGDGFNNVSSANVARVDCNNSHALIIWVSNRGAVRLHESVNCASVGRNCACIESEARERESAGVGRASLARSTGRHTVRISGWSICTQLNCVESIVSASAVSSPTGSVRVVIKAYTESGSRVGSGVIDVRSEGIAVVAGVRASSANWSGCSTIHVEIGQIQASQTNGHNLSSVSSNIVEWVKLSIVQRICLSCEQSGQRRVCSHFFD